MGRFCLVFFWRNTLKKYIYKITNKINNKSYIGQTKNYKRRFSNHRTKYKKTDGQERNKLLYRAMRKYGIENFTFEVIDYCEDYNEKEIFYISKFDSFNNGYNMTIGGEEPPKHVGENSPFLKHTSDNHLKVKDLLMNSKLSKDEISQQTGYSKSAINRINNGAIWRDNTLQYPLRMDSLSYCLTNELVEAITHDLINTNESQKSMSKRYGISRSTITMINNGNHHRRPHLQYPLRQKK